MLSCKVLVTLSLWLFTITNCLSFQLKSRKQILIPQFQTKSVVASNINTNVKTILMSTSPVLSLDKVVIPYWDRRVFSKFGLFFAVTWLISILLKPKVDYEFLLTFLDEKKQQINNAFSTLVSKTEGLVSLVRNRISTLDISSWRQFSLKKVVPINSSYSLYQFSAGSLGRLDNVDIGQEVK